MKIPYYHVDCFTEKRFCGNPAAVCVLQEWLPDATLQTMAKEHNLPATTFIKFENNAYTIRWFAPDTEIPLCGHGSIGAAYVIFKHLQPTWPEVSLVSPLNTVKVQQADNGFVLDFPGQQLEPAVVTEAIINVLGVKPLAFYSNVTALALLENQQQVLQVNANLAALRQLPYRNLIITAAGDNVDFVSRNFYMQKMETEDPVTGSAHCILAPFWARRLNKAYLMAQQISARCGELICEVKNDRVYLHGKAVLYQKGEIGL